MIEYKNLVDGTGYSVYRNMLFVITVCPFLICFFIEWLITQPITVDISFIPLF